MADAPERIRVAQDAEGFWTCREAVSGSQEYVRADLYAALEARLDERVWVKPLAWEKESASWIASTAFFGARYVITECAGMKEPFKLSEHNTFGTYSQHFVTLDKAKAAAQADFERRILSALEPAAPIVNRPTQQEMGEHCPDCDGTGFSNHPDSGQHCYRCDGQGAIRPEPAGDHRSHRSQQGGKDG